MFPIRDTHASNTFPFINYLLILVNVGIFFYQITPPSPDNFIGQFAFIPNPFVFSNPLTYFPAFTSMFLHGGWFHLLSNMWFLHIFGDNIEGAIGHTKYLIFYIVCG